MKKISNNKKYANEILDDVECYKMVLNGTLKKFPNGFWTKPWSYESAKSITQYMLKVKVGDDLTKLKGMNRKVLFSEMKLMGMVVNVYDGNSWEAISAAVNTGDKIYHPWELGGVPKGYWASVENVKKAIRWAVEEKVPHGFNIRTDFNVEYLNAVGLYSLLNSYSMHELLNLVYPNRYMPWEMVKVTSNFWADIDNKKKAITWLINKKLPKNFNVELDFSCKLLELVGLESLRGTNTLQELLDLAYPNKYTLTHIHSGIKDHWTFNSIRSVLKLIYKTEYNYNKRE